MNNKFESGELSKKENTINPNNGTNSSIPLISSESTKQPILYNFEAILAIAFSVNSKRALQVRRWANKKITKCFSYMQYYSMDKYIGEYCTE